MSNKSGRKKVGKSLTVADLIKNADKIKNKKKETRQLYVKSFEANITIEKPNRSIILDSYEMEENEGNLYLVYECVIDPSLKDEELQKEYGVKGYEIVNEIFDAGEVDSIAKEIVSFAGYGDSVSVVDNIKN